MSIEKINSAKGALKYVKDGMCIGLGTGTTVREFIPLLAKKMKDEKLKITAVCTSYDTRMLAFEHEIFVLEPDNATKIDLAVDGADIATANALLKGGGGALTREKIVDYAAKEFLIIMDEAKLKKELEGRVVIEVLPFAVGLVIQELKKISPDVSVRFGDRKAGPVISDNGNFLLDWTIKVKNPKEMEERLNSIPGIVENGIFTKFSKLIIGTKTGFREIDFSK
jgi:ribose 5-phosphate isomerase A